MTCPGGSSSIRSLDRRLQPTARAFIRYLEARGISVTITSTRRSMRSQACLYRRYRAGLSRFPAAPPGRSTHGQGMAFDLKLDPPVYEQAGRLWESLGLRWGGRFRDPIHFDFRPRV